MSKIFFLSLLALSLGVQPGYYTEWFEMPVDHMNRDAGTFSIRALVQTNAYHNSTTAPMLVYTGNEGNVEGFFNWTGFMTTTLQEEFEAKVVFLEHRYYGESIPPATAVPFQYLNTDQVLFDFARMVEALKPYPEAPVIAFGGSYGGMLSAMFRLKYPHIVDGAIASSAPLLMRWVDTEAFYNLTSNVYENISKPCAQHLGYAFSFIQVIQDRSDLYEDLSLIFKSCTQFSSPDHVDSLLAWLADTYEEMVQYDFPYDSNIFTPQTPANPATAACKPIEDMIAQNKTDLWSLFNATLEGAKVYNGDKECYDIIDYGDDIVGETWTYQKCTELPMPYGSNGQQDIFYNNTYSFEKWDAYCQKRYGIQPRINWEAINYGMYPDIAHQLRYTSNIVFTDGMIDPWSVGGIKGHINHNIPTYFLEDSAHHLELREPNSADPTSVKDVRQSEITNIKLWIAQKLKHTGKA